MPRDPEARSSKIERGKKFNLPKELVKPMTSTKCRLSYVHLLEPWTGQENKPARYSVQCLWDADDPWLKLARTRIRDVAIAAFGEHAPRLLKGGKLKQPFRVGDDDFPDDEVYAGKVFCNANGAYEGRKPPDILDPYKRNIRDMEDPEFLCYSGMYGRVSVTFLPYDMGGGRGVRCALNHVQFWEHGEPLAGGPSSESVFDVIEDAEDPFAKRKSSSNDNEDDDGEFDDDDEWEF